MPTFVSLRRAGDIICLLPLLRNLRLRDGVASNLVVHTDFVPLLEGVSYVNPIGWHGDWEDPLAAAKAHNGINCQVFGRGLSPDTIHGNFAKIAWNHAGYEWNRHVPLVFDKRDLAREEALAQSVFKQNGKPKLLLKLHGYSSPFHDAEFVRQQLRIEFPEFEMVDLDSVKAERIYDLCGLMDKAACLVTADTVTLWLSHASTVPSIAFTNGTMFGASPSRGNCLFRTPYHDVRRHWPHIGNMIRKCTAIKAPENDNMVLVFSDYRPSDADAQRRQNIAYQTWLKFPARLYPFSTVKNSNMVGDPRGMPFVRDMITAALSSGREDIVVITNNDIKFDPRLADEMKASVAQCGCWWAYRTEHYGGPTDEGADVFALSRKWWHLHEHLFPDFLLGYWGWDDVAVRLMRWSGCGEGSGLYYHEKHHATESPTRQHSPGAAHNARLMNEWLKLHDEDRRKP